MSCSFSSNNGKRAIKMISFAMLLTAATYAASAIFNDNITIRFNVIHCIALSVLLWTCIDWIRIRCVRNWQKNVFGFVCFAVIIAVLVVGYCCKNQPVDSNNKAFFFLLPHTGFDYAHFKGGDYVVLNVAHDHETYEEQVVYMQIYDKPKVWVRPLKMFLEDVNDHGNIKPRFEFIDKME